MSPLPRVSAAIKCPFLYVKEQVKPSILHIAKTSLSPIKASTSSNSFVFWRDNIL